MSEYQYYEFQAIDKPLSEKDMDSLGDLSSRAIITPTSFINEYNYGDFRGSPLKLMGKYFDAFLYVANWGTRWFMLRVPRKLIDIDMARQYCIGDSATIHEKGEYLIFEFTSETEDYEWEEGEGWLSSLISLRSDILGGDYRCLYLAWLFCVQMDEFEENEVEPPVPPNLGNLNASLNSFINFMRINTDLVTVASKNSVSKDPQGQDQKALKSWISNLPAKEKDDIVFRLIKDHDPHLGTELMQRFRKDSSVAGDDARGMVPRSVEDLQEEAEAYSAERARKTAEQKAKEQARKKREKAIARETYLNDLAQREDTIWKTIEPLILTRRPSDYDEVVTLLVDLRDISRKKNKEEIFESKLRGICEKHRRKSSLISRFIEAGLGVNNRR